MYVCLSVCLSFYLSVCMYVCRIYSYSFVKWYNIWRYIYIMFMQIHTIHAYGCIYGCWSTLSLSETAILRETKNVAFAYVRGTVATPSFAQTHVEEYCLSRRQHSVTTARCSDISSWEICRHEGSITECESLHQERLLRSGLVLQGLLLCHSFQNTTLARSSA